MTAAIALPFAAALRSASGAWGLTLKPHYTLLVRSTYEQHDDYVERRVAWSQVSRRLQTEDGRWVPRRIVESADVGGYLQARLRRPDVWLENLVTGLAGTRWEFLAFLAVGLTGLVWLRGSRRAELAVAVASMAPFLLTPLFFHARDRYLLPLVPALIWGGSALLESALEWARRRGLPPAAAPAALLCCGIALSTSGALAVGGPRPDAWRTEIAVLLREGRGQEALSATDAWTRGRPDDGVGWLARADALDAAGRSDAAREAAARSVRAGGVALRAATWYLERRMLDEAGGALQGVDERERGSLEYLSAARRLAFAGEDWARAIELSEHFARLGLENDAMRFNRGLAHFRLGQVEDARRYLEAGLGAADSTLRVRSAALLRRLPPRGPPPDG